MSLPILVRVLVCQCLRLLLLLLLYEGLEDTAPWLSSLTLARFDGLIQLFRDQEIFNSDLDKI